MDGYLPMPSRRLVFRRLASKEKHLLPALRTPMSSALTSWTDWYSGLLTLRAWCSTKEAGLRRASPTLCLEDARGAAAHVGRELLSAQQPAVSCSLVIMGTASFRQRWRGHEGTTDAAQLRGDVAIAIASQNEAREMEDSGGAAYGRLLPSLPTFESLPLWFLIKHSRRRAGMHQLWALDEHWERICELLGTRWVVFGGPNLMDNWSFRREVRTVALLPSFFFCAEAHQRYRKALDMWPQATIVCYAPRNSPCLQAFQRMLASHTSTSSRIRTS